MGSRLAYTSTTGSTLPPFIARKFKTDPEVVSIWDNDPHCFVCRRHTDHGGEHDALVDAGLAEYTDEGSVRRTDKWDDAVAAEISKAEYAALYGAVLA